MREATARRDVQRVVEDSRSVGRLAEYRIAFGRGDAGAIDRAATRQGPETARPRAGIHDRDGAIRVEHVRTWRRSVVVGGFLEIIEARGVIEVGQAADRL